MAGKSATARKPGDLKADYRRQIHERIRQALAEAADARPDQFLVQTISCVFTEILRNFKDKAEANSTFNRQAACKALPPSFDPESMVQRGKMLGRAAEANELARELDWVIEALE